ncbi:hypothetical protein OH809_43155 [Streptomyces sp. NBC_00873]|uniref:hypothetical protein n=1 Tax=unclassified Streptomyces TaxID=2593676 RepID=UPI003865DFBD|nr:hypothetical protein OH809_00555 [Streptomyces sp. NBC_00873]WSY97457.1 hypothetical protein OH809_43155 [Streptomyces sp. NBC_00873]WTA49085.1 hypothetical protein OH821_00555 [Streptomyces sp. NBC_00842]WTA49127.1 hypothetical protein OH821_43260 [Streptomyces sp. NBC_00842]
MEPQPARCLPAQVTALALFTSSDAALTRRFEEVAEKTDREFGIIKSDLTAVRLQVGNLDQKVDRLDGRLDSLSQQMERSQAQIIELLAQLVGRDPAAG